MSGGHWNYLKQRFDEAAEPEEKRLAEMTLRVMGQVEKELDWGLSCDTCYECAKMRVIYGLEAFFSFLAPMSDLNPWTLDGVLTALRKGPDPETRCAKCVERYAEIARAKHVHVTAREVFARGGLMGDSPSLAYNTFCPECGERLLKPDA